MESWLTAHGINSVERPKWNVPTAQDVQPEPAKEERQVRPPAQSAEVDTSRARLHELVDAIAGRDIESAEAFLEFLRNRRRDAPRSQSQSAEVAVVPAKAADRESH